MEEGRGRDAAIAGVKDTKSEMASSPELAD